MESTIKDSSKETDESLQSRSLGRWTVEVLEFDQFEKFLGEANSESIDAFLRRLKSKNLQMVLGSVVHKKNNKNEDEHEWQNKD